MIKSRISRGAMPYFVFGCILAALCLVFLIVSVFQIMEAKVVFWILAGIFALCGWLLIKYALPSKGGPTPSSLDTVANATVLPVVEYPSAVILRDKEVCHYQRGGYVVVVKNQVVGRTGGYGGASVRIAKGLTIHSGSSAGRTIRKDVTYTYPGILTMTNQRIMMTGEKGFEYPIKKLTSLSPYNGFAGIILQFGRSSFTVIAEETYWIPKILDLLHEGPCIEKGSTYSEIEPEEQTSTHPTAQASGTMASEIEELCKLKDSGALTEEEFAAVKKKILGI